MRSGPSMRSGPAAPPHPDRVTRPPRTDDGCGRASRPARRPAGPSGPGRTVSRGYFMANWVTPDMTLRCVNRSTMIA